MSTALDIAILSVAGCYAALLIMLYLGFLLRANFELKEIPDKKIAVIVAVRNEENNIKTLLNALNEQSVLPSEVIIVDDESEDATVSIVKSLVVKYSLRCIPSTGRGKKDALTSGVNSTDAEIILVTDGDCVPGRKWVESFSHLFAEEKTIFAAGLIKYNAEGGIFRHVLQTEMTFLQVAAAGMYELGFPAMCNGASMAFTKEFFKEAGGFGENVFVSGDDILLLHKATEKNKSGVKWNYDREAIVTTEAAKNFSEATRQHHRWISKFRGYRSASTLFAAVLFLLVQLLLPATIIVSVSIGTINNPFMYAFGVKTGVELLFLSLASPYFGEKKIIPVYPLSAILYEIISLGAMLRLVRNDVSWKGRMWHGGKLK